MVTVCAWCQKYQGSKEPLDDPAVSHGICSACVEHQVLGSTPVLVVSPARAGTISLLQSLLRGAPEIAIVVDRRNGERRNGHGRASGNGGGHGSRTPRAADRRLSDRRRSPALYLV
jgi:hypothetical protein